MNKVDLNYQNLLKDILENGVKKETRNGSTISVFGRQIRHKMSEGFPLLTTKKMHFKSITTELLWFLRGEVNIKYLLDNDCNIWTGDAYKNYCNQIPEYSKQFTMSKEEYIEKIKTDDEFAKKWGELGPVYGKQWRSWTHHYPKTYPEVSQYEQYIGVKKIDQIANLIKELKTNPDSRRLIVNAWAVHDLPNMVLPPCHYGFQVYTRELSNKEKWEQYIKSGLNIEINGTPLEFKHIGTPFYPKSLPQRAISLMYNARSQDVPLGTPFNIASYALLLEIIAKMVNMVPDELITNMGDCHIYLNQIDGIKEQLKREPYPLPNLVISNQVNFNEGIDEFLKSCLITDFKIENYQSHPTIKMPLSN